MYKKWTFLNRNPITKEQLKKTLKVKKSERRSKQGERGRSRSKRRRSKRSESNLRASKKKTEEKKKELRKLHEKEFVETASALKKFARQFIVGGEPGFDLKSFFNVVKQSLLQILRENRQQKVKLILKCLMKKIDLKTAEETRVEAAFHSETKINLSGTNEKKLLDIMIEEALENMAQFQRRGSNWRFVEVLKLELHLRDFVPLKGNSWIPLPEAVSEKKAVINMKNKDNECFKWCVTRALNPVDKNAERITQKLRKQAEELNWKDLEFPMEVDKIEKFENNSNIFVNVFFILMEVFSH